MEIPRCTRDDVPLEFLIMYIKIILLLLLCSNAVYATSQAPWMTGALLAPAGETVKPGHINFEPYNFYTIYSTPYRNNEISPVIEFGLLNFLDIMATAPYDISWDRGQKGHKIGDSTVALGLQIHRQKDGSVLPNFRIIVQEILPSGMFDDLDPDKLGTDQTGVGSYQTTLGFNFEYLSLLINNHYLKSHLSLVGSKGSDVNVKGNNAFGGSLTTDGKVKPGFSYSVDLAFEYQLTQNWVPVFEALYTHSGTLSFAGNPGFTPGGAIGSIGGDGGNVVSLAPAIEYNFNSNIGIIAGVWFTISGPGSGKFISNTIALSYTF